jgi:hypothetical protein
MPIRLPITGVPGIILLMAGNRKHQSETFEQRHIFVP